jgi:hypothetical protein
MERNVVSLEMARKLKAAGFEIDEPAFGWLNYEANWIVLEWYEINEDMEWYIAPTAQEIADQLKDTGADWSIEPIIDSYLVKETITTLALEAGSMAEALAALYLKLHEPLPNNTPKEKDHE